ncbi:MAG TPA: N-acetyltransferase [Beijerinckiaceae bacterium]|nr:N-acetyltransferase [Beijerinckiaceae bacterium]
MTDLKITLHAEQPGDAEAIERLNERAFGPGRFARTAERIREQAGPRLDLSFVARVATLLVGSVRLTPIRIGDAAGLMLGPLAVEPAFRSRGIGRLLIERALKEAQAKGLKLVLLVGDLSYYGKLGFQPVPMGRITMPGPVDPARLLLWSADDAARSEAHGAVRGG